MVLEPIFDDYSPLVVDLFERRPHAGRMAASIDVAEGCGGSQLQGAEVWFWLKHTAGRIQATSFLAYGCPHVIAAASWLAQRVRGLPLGEVEGMDYREMEQTLAVPPQKRGRLLIVEDALKAAARGARRNV